MTNIELLELAAKAAGIEVWRGRNFQSDSLFRNSSKNSGVISAIEWNPLRDDGDALRLSAALGLHLHYSDEFVRCGRGISVFDIKEPLSTDRYAAVRRLVVRAAAEIGKGMR